MYLCFNASLKEVKLGFINLKKAKITFNKVSKIIKDEFDRIDNYDLKKIMKQKSSNIN